MKIIEQFIKGKKPESSLCEDMLFISEDFIAVIDGATAKSERLFNGKAGGRVAAEAVYESIKSFSPDIESPEAIYRITESISALYEEGEEKGCAAASAIILSLNRKEIWSVGDCQCIINGEKHLHEKEIDKILSEKRATVLEAAINNGATEDELRANDTGRLAILPQLKEQHKYANSEGKLGYGVFNGTPVPEKFIVTYKLNKGDCVVLASDGYPVLCDTLAQSEKLLETELNENSLCYKNYKSTKGLSPENISFDDRTYIKIEI